MDYLYVGRGSQMTRIRQKSLLSAMGWNGLSTGINYAATITGNVLIARALGPSILGQVSYVIWLVSVVAQVVSGGLPYATQVYASARIAHSDHEGARHILTRSLRISTLITTATAVLVTIVAPDNTRQWGWQGTAILLLMLYAVPVRAILGIRASADMDYRLVGRINNIGGLAFLALAVLTYILRQPLFALAASVSLYAVPAVCWVVTSLFRRQNGERAADCSDSGVQQRPFLHLALEHWIMMIVTVLVWGRVELGLVTWLASADEVGYFSAAIQTAGPVATPTTLLTAPLLVYTLRSRSQGHGASTTEAAGSILRVFSILSGFAALAISFSSTLLVAILFGPAFGPASASIPWLAFASFTFALISIFSASAQGMERPFYPLIAMASSAPFHVVLSLLLVPSLGSQGASIAQMISRIVSLVVIWRLVERDAPGTMRARDCSVLGAAFGLPVLLWATLGHRTSDWVSLPALIAALLWAWGVLRLGAFLRSSDYARAEQLANRLPRWMASVFGVLLASFGSVQARQRDALDATRMGK